jgi:hypothetical protein
MSAISWKGVTGDWSTAADWSGGKVPTSSDDVTIAVPGGYTVTISKASSAKSLNLNDANATIVDVASLQVAGTLNVLAGAFDLGTGGSVSAAQLNVSTGALLKKFSGTDISKISAKLVNAGTVLATSGTLQFTGGGQFAAAGSVAGNGGTVDLNAGTFALAAATAKFDGGVLIDGFADFNIGAGKTLTMAGVNTFNTANGFDGSGALITTGTVTAKAGNVGGTAIWRDTGTVIQTGNFGIQSTATIATAATTGTWNITGDFGIPFSSDGTFINAGLLEKTAGVGTSAISAFLVNTGTVVAKSGTLQFTGGGQFGATGSIAGNGGTIEFTTGTFSLASSTAKISGGALFDGFLTVEINAGQTLTLAGTDTVNAPNGTFGGSGTLLTTGRSPQTAPSWPVMPPGSTAPRCCRPAVSGSITPPPSRQAPPASGTSPPTPASPSQAAVRSPTPACWKRPPALAPAPSAPTCGTPAPCSRNRARCSSPGEADSVPRTVSSVVAAQWTSTAVSSPLHPQRRPSVAGCCLMASLNSTSAPVRRLRWPERTS